MKRIVWLGIGVAVGVYAYSKVRKVARQYTPAGVSEKAEHLASDVVGRVETTVKGLASDFTSAYAAREKELMDQLLADTQESVAEMRARRARHAARPSPGNDTDITDVDPDEEALGYSF